MPADLAADFQVKDFTATQPATVEINGSEWRVLLVPVREKGQQPYWVLVVRSLEETEEPLDRLLLFILIALPLTLLVAKVLGLLLF